MLNYSRHQEKFRVRMLYEVTNKVLSGLIVLLSKTSHNSTFKIQHST